MLKRLGEQCGGGEYCGGHGHGCAANAGSAAHHGYFVSILAHLHPPLRLAGWRNDVGIAAYRIVHLLALCFFVVWVSVENMSQVAINMAAITGPITKPLRPKIAMPPSVEISTT